MDRIVDDGTLNANPAIAAARDRVPLPGLKFQVTAFMVQAAGGPKIYAGRNMKESLAHLNINEREWEAILADLRASLYRYNVPDLSSKRS
jgi:hemoglobin